MRRVSVSMAAGIFAAALCLAGAEARAQTPTNATVTATSVTEGSAVTITVTLDSPLSAGGTISWELMSGAGNGVTVPLDFTAASGIENIPANGREITFNITTEDDDRIEYTEAAIIEITGAEINRSSATFDVTDNEIDVLNVQFAETSATYAISGDSTVVEVPLTAVPADSAKTIILERPVTVWAKTNSGPGVGRGGFNAVAGEHYTDLTNQEVTFAPGTEITSADPAEGAVNVELLIIGEAVALQVELSDADPENPAALADPAVALPEPLFTLRAQPVPTASLAVGSDGLTAIESADPPDVASLDLSIGNRLDGSTAVIEFTLTGATATTALTGDNINQRDVDISTSDIGAPIEINTNGTGGTIRDVSFFEDRLTIVLTPLPDSDNIDETFTFTIDEITFTRREGRNTVEIDGADIAGGDIEGVGEGIADNVATITITDAAPTAGICRRTPEVQAAILGRITGVDRCQDVTTMQLISIDTLSVSFAAPPRVNDFDGLDTLTGLTLSGGFERLNVGTLDSLLDTLTALSLPDAVMASFAFSAEPPDNTNVNPASSTTLTVTLDKPVSVAVRLPYTADYSAGAEDAQFTGESGALIFPVSNVSNTSQSFTVAATADVPAAGSSITITLGTPELGTVRGNGDFVPFSRPGSADERTAVLSEIIMEGRETARRLTTPPYPDIITAFAKELVDGQLPDLIEGNTVLYGVTLNRPALIDTNITYTITGAVDIDDFTSRIPPLALVDDILTGMLTITKGESSGVIDLTAVLDGLIEGSEEFQIELAATGLTFAEGAQTIRDTIIDGDGARRIRSVTATPSVTEGASVTFAITLDAAAAAETVLPYTISGDVDADDFTGDDNADGDGDILTGMVTVPFGMDNTATFITVSQEDDGPAAENMIITFGASTRPALGASYHITANADDANNRAEITILDPPPDRIASIVITDAEVGENEGVEVTVVLNRPPLADATVTYEVGATPGAADGVEDDDFGAISTATIPASTDNITFTKSVTFTVPINDDNHIENTESGRITITGINWINGSINLRDVNNDFSGDQLDKPGDEFLCSSARTEQEVAALCISPFADFTITDNDTVAVEIVQSAYEFDEDVASPQVMVRITGDVQISGLTATLTSAEGSATSAVTVPPTADFTAVSQIITIDPVDHGTGTLVTVPLTIVNDNAVEDTERFTLALGASSSSINIIEASATVDITDNDMVAVEMVASAYEFAENAATTDVQVRITGNVEASSLQYTLTSTDSTAVSPADFTAVNGIFTVPADDHTAGTLIPVSLTIAEDSVVEDTERFTLALGTSSSSINITGVSATVDITDSDMVTIGFALATDLGIPEGESRDVTVSILSGVLARDAVVRLSTGDSNPVSATALDDYTVINNRELTFSATDTSHTIAIQTADDSVLEGLETFTLTLTTTDPAVIVSPGTRAVNILDDDAVTIGFTAETVDVTEGGMTRVEVRILNNRTLQNNVTVMLSTGDSNPVSAVEEDYTAINNMALVFNATATRHTINIEAENDSLLESMENFTLTLTTNDVVTLAPATATVRIADDDEATIGFTATAISINEGGEMDVTVNVLGTTTLERSVAVKVSTRDVTAMEPDDYTAISMETLTFTAAPTVSQSITIRIPTDMAVEANETFTLHLATTDLDVVLNPATATVTIGEVLIDGALTVGFSSATYSTSEDAGSVDLTAIVTGSVTLERPVVVDLSSEDGTATAGADYTAIPAATQLTFTALNQPQIFAVAITSDDEDEGESERFAAMLANANTGSVADSVLTLDPARTVVTIIDEDTQATGVMSVTARPDSIPEDGGETTITVILNGRALGGDITLHYEIARASQTDDITHHDFASHDRLERHEVTIPQGSDRASFTITTAADSDVETPDQGEERFFVTVSDNADGNSGLDFTSGNESSNHVVITELDVAVVADELEALSFIVAMEEIRLTQRLIRQRIEAPFFNRPDSSAPTTSLTLPDNPQNMDDMIDGLALSTGGITDSGWHYGMWTRGHRNNIDGTPTVNGSVISYNGNATGIGGGMEWSNGIGLIGLAANYIITDIALSEVATNISRYREKIIMTAPYFSVRHDRVAKYWGMLAAGVGDAQATLNRSVTDTADVQVGFAAIGADITLINQGDEEVVFGISGHGMRKEVEKFTFGATGTIPEKKVETLQGRGELTWFRNIVVGDELLRPHIGIASLHDFGDVISDDRHALDARAGITYSKGGLEVGMEVTSEFLRKDREQWSFTGGISWDTRLDGRGLRLGLDSTHTAPIGGGVSADGGSGGVDRSWEVTLDGSYGLPAPVIHRDGLLTPFAGVTERHNQREISGGMRLSIGNGIGLDFESLRRIDRDEPDFTEHRVGLRGRWSF